MKKNKKILSAVLAIMLMFNSMFVNTVFAANQTHDCNINNLHETVVSYDEDYEW